MTSQFNFGYTFGRTPEKAAKELKELKERLANPPKPPQTPPTTPANPPTTDHQQQTTSPPQTTNNQLPTIVTPAQTNLDFWTIPEVNFRNIKGDVHVLNGLLDNSATKTQDEWASYSEVARAQDQFYVPDNPLLYATIERAFELKDDSGYKTSVEDMRVKLKQLSRANWLMTLTRIAYSPKGKDKIIHNYGLSDQCQPILEDFVGQNGEIPAGSSEKLYQNLLGTTSNLVKIKNVFNWLNETPVYIWRLNSKPKNIDERVARFIANSGRSYLICNRRHTSSDASLGVRYARPTGRAQSKKNLGGKK